MSASLVQQAKAWMEKDPDPKTKEQLAAFIDSNDTKELQASFNGRLEFGTAGLRGVMGVGPTKMNVSQALVPCEQRGPPAEQLYIAFNCSRNDGRLCRIPSEDGPRQSHQPRCSYCF